MTNTLDTTVRPLGDAAGDSAGSQTSGRLQTADEVAAFLQVPRSWVYAAARRGAIPTVVLGRYYRFERHAIEQWLREQTRHGG